MGPDSGEWLEADGLGGFASGTVAGPRTRRYHALLLAATTPPTGRVVLVNGFDAWVETPGCTCFLSHQRYEADMIRPDNGRAPERFEREPWPRWTYVLSDGTRIIQEIFVCRGAARTAVSWRLAEGGAGPVRLAVRPFLSGRDYHALQRENPAFRFEPRGEGPRLTWTTYEGVPPLTMLSNARYEHQPFWYRSFLYEREQERGLDCVEDLAAPGILHWDLSSGPAVWLLSAGESGASGLSGDALETYARLRAQENARRSAFPTPLHRAADAYIVRRGAGATIIAGYPWFTDWGRDAFIALRGLSLATDRLDDARGILISWAGSVSRGMLPNRFPDAGATPEYNAVDASLWYVVACAELDAAARRRGVPLPASDRAALLDAISAILAGYAEGTRYRIHADEDGLLAAGEPGVQLTWMDAKVGDWVVTPRIGKPVEVQALWLNALHAAIDLTGAAHPHAARWSDLLARGRAAFESRFWNEAAGGLYDVVDVDHQPGRVDPAFRPNQVFAVGGLPLPLLSGERARRLVDSVERRLLTPLGLRSLAPGEHGYLPRYEGGVWQRDGAYHQGTVWVWLIGPFVEAWVRVRGSTAQAKREARERFLTPLRAHLEEAGLGHLSEIADAEPPHTPRGCPFQAWSLGELLRLELDVLA